jgi:type IV pilus assembly protein PilB
LAVEHAPATEISAAALRSGMVTLRNDGMTKVLNGVTSIDEILRVVV